MAKAWIGPPREEWQNLICGYAPSPEALHCDRDATWHGLKIDDPDLIAMECCDDHLPVMLLLVDYAHPLVHPCSIPGSLFRWPENECYTEWSEQSEFAQAIVAGTV